MNSYKYVDNHEGGNGPVSSPVGIGNKSAEERHYVACS